MTKFARGVFFIVVCFALIFSCAHTAINTQPLYHGSINNKTEMIVDIAIVDMANGGKGEFVSGNMLSPGESWSVDLPAGHYHIVASCANGYFSACLVLPDMLRHPNQPWYMDLEVPDEPLKRGPTSPMRI